jgi:hypothetical protein
MRMVAPDMFGSYTNKPPRGTVTCRGNNNPGGPETRAFTANGLKKITLPHGCTAETDTHIFAAADDGFRRSDNDYTISYVWPFDPLTLTPGLDTKLFSDVLKNKTEMTESDSELLEERSSESRSAAKFTRNRPQRLLGKVFGFNQYMKGPRQPCAERNLR